MKKAEMKAYKELLLAWRARLRGDVTTMADAALRKTRSEANGDLSSMPIHMADIGSDNYEQEFTLSLMQSDEMTLESIETAIERIEDGVFGQCEECQGPDQQGPAERDSLHAVVHQVCPEARTRLAITLSAAHFDRQ